MAPFIASVPFIYFEQKNFSHMKSYVKSEIIAILKYLKKKYKSIKGHWSYTTSQSLLENIHACGYNPKNSFIVKVSKHTTCYNSILTQCAFH